MDTTITFAIVPKLDRNCGETTVQDILDATKYIGKFPDSIFIFIPTLNTENELRCLKGSVNYQIFKNAKIITSDLAYSTLFINYSDRLFIFKGNNLIREAKIKTNIRIPTINKNGLIFLKRPPKQFSDYTSSLIKNKILELHKNTGLLQIFNASNGEFVGSPFFRAIQN
jgi:hypothetical protein